MDFPGDDFHFLRADSRASAEAFERRLAAVGIRPQVLDRQDGERVLLFSKGLLAWLYGGWLKSENVYGLPSGH
jgi:hypothetical protein